MNFTFSVQPATDITAADYTVSNYTVTVPAGAKTATVAVTILDDKTVESTEQVTFGINAVSAKLAIGSQKIFWVNVSDNDKSEISFSTGNAFISENAGAYQINLNLEQAAVNAQTA